MSKRLLMKNSKARILLWDLETSNLNANFGFIICASYKWHGERDVHTIRIDDYPIHRTDPTNDYHVVKELSAVLAQADVQVTWYGLRFDYPYLQSRLLFHGLPVLPPIPHVDGWRIAKYKLKLNSNRLASAAAFLGCGHKTELSPPQWIKAMAGNREAIDYVVTHCIQDVRVLQRVYGKIRQVADTHPNVNLACPNRRGHAPHCPTCGSTDMQHRGWHIAKVVKKKRYSCKACGTWSSGGPVRIKTIEVR